MKCPHCKHDEKDHFPSYGCNIVIKAEYARTTIGDCEMDTDIRCACKEYKEVHQNA